MTKGEVNLKEKGPFWEHHRRAGLTIGEPRGEGMWPWSPNYSRAQARYQRGLTGTRTSGPGFCIGSSGKVKVRLSLLHLNFSDRKNEPKDRTESSTAIKPRKGRVVREGLNRDYN